MAFVLTWHILKVLDFGEVDSSLLFDFLDSYSVSIFFISGLSEVTSTSCNE